MSNEGSSMSFSKEFQEKLKQRQESMWRCPKCFTYTSNSLERCRSCDAKKPRGAAPTSSLSSSGTTDSEKEEAKANTNLENQPASTLKRESTTSLDEEPKRTNSGGFKFVPSGNVQSTSIFDAAFKKPISTFKFGTGPNAVVIRSKSEDIPKESVQEESGKKEHDETPKNTSPEDDDNTEVTNRQRISCKEALNQLSASKDYEVFVFGSGECGQLGLGNDCLHSGKPLLQPAASAIHPLHIACGSQFNLVSSCDGETVVSWGNNDECSLGREGVEDTPLPITSPLLENTQVDRVFAGGCAGVILTKDGEVLSWGTYRDSHGLIGWSKGVKKQPTPQPISFPKDIKISKIACGESHVLALTTQGVLFSWGSCEQGQLGFRPPASLKRNALVPRELEFKEGRKAIEVSDMWAGGMHSMVKLSNGHIYVFGLNNWGQLGNGRRRERPELIQRVPFFDGKEVVSAALGQHSTLVLTDDGKLYSAGRNSYGQLGRETIDECDAEFGEVELPKGVRFQQIAAGYHHFIAIDEFGRLYTMGFGEMQQLGNGDKYEDETRLYRVKSEELETRRVVFAAGGSQHTLILTEKLFIVCSTNMGSRQRH